MRFYYKKYPITSALITICVIVYIYTTLKYGLEMDAYQGLESGGFNPLIVFYAREYYRLITANFIHFGIMHIFCNCYSLYNFGCVMEHLLGQKRYAIVLFASMFATTFLPLILFLINGSGVDSIMGGISGAIFGLMGALMALALKFKNVYAFLFKQISTSIILMLVISFLVPTISLVGHISGMIGGFIAMLLIIRFMPLAIWKRYAQDYYSPFN